MQLLSFTNSTSLGRLALPLGSVNFRTFAAPAAWNKALVPGGRGLKKDGPPTEKDLPTLHTPSAKQAGRTKAGVSSGLG
jgi:hypothetical protein